MTSPSSLQFNICSSDFSPHCPQLVHERVPVRCSGDAGPGRPNSDAGESSRMNIVSKSKKRVVLPSRPNPPTVDQILEDIDGAAPSDPVFSILEKNGPDSSRPSPDSDVELKFQQCREYLELNEQLKEARERLLQQRRELRAAGEQLEEDVEEVKGRTL